MSNGKYLIDAYESMQRIFRDVPYTEDEKIYDLLNDIVIAIVEYRIDNRLTERMLAEKLGVSRQKLGKYESGDYNFTVKEINNICNVIGYKFNISLEKKKAEE